MIKTTFAILLAFAALGFAVLWIASYFTNSDWAWELSDACGVGVGLDVQSGHALFLAAYLPDAPSDWYFSWGYPPLKERKWYSVTVSSGNSHGCRVSSAIFPLWAAFLVTAWFPVLVLYRGPLRRRRRRKLGLCLHCGYDLKGTVDPRCPECGTSSVVCKSLSATKPAT